MKSENDTYKYKLMYHGKAIYFGATYDIARRSVEHERDFPRATLKQVGGRVTREEALKWVSRQSRTSYVRNVGTI